MSQMYCPHPASMKSKCIKAIFKFTTRRGSSKDQGSQEHSKNYEEEEIHKDKQCLEAFPFLPESKHTDDSAVT